MFFIASTQRALLPKSWNFIAFFKLPEWRETMSQELNALVKHKTWILVPSSSDKNVIGCK
jgi:hypothetical protein